MSYPDPNQPWQQPAPGHYPPATPAGSGPYGYGYPPNNGAYPPAQPYGAYQQQPPYYPPPPVPQPAAQRNGGNSRFWRFLEGLLVLGTGNFTDGFGKTARARVMTVLIIFGVTFVVLAGLILLGSR
ncbi:hypothetical protein A5768_26045 [Mycolicibacterium fortuitum]|uniref:hypothetical protein n=1 Tax=Mycolicibacterium fortuitum TaxID=1766 RepID=UPI0007EBCF0A|nr:hypothetical protein [Mycolicibacterium fortuitum]OBG21569.1 hypothetical protein A5768_26045 [Mycolicibacterium fortuitum]